MIDTTRTNRSVFSEIGKLALAFNNSLVEGPIVEKTVETKMGEIEVENYIYEIGQEGSNFKFNEETRQVVPIDSPYRKVTVPIEVITKTITTTYTKKGFEGRISCYALEKLSRIALDVCKFLNKGKVLSALLNRVFLIVDATRFVADFYDFYNYATAKKEDITISNCGIGLRVSYFAVNVLTFAYALHEYNLMDMGKISSAVGSVCTYAGLSVSLATVAPWIGVGLVALFTFKLADQILQGKFNLLDAVGTTSEITLRAIGIFTGTGWMLIPALDLISNGVGYFRLLQKSYRDNEAADELYNLQKNGQLEKSEEILSEQKNETSLEEVEQNPITQNVLSSTLNVGSRIVKSSALMSKTLRVASSAMILFAANLPTLLTGISNFILLDRCISIFKEVYDNIGSQENREKIIKNSWAKIAAASLPLIAAVADIFYFVTKTDIAGLEAYAGTLGQIHIFGLVGNLGFGFVKPTLMMIYLPWTIYSTLSDKNSYQNEKIALRNLKWDAMVGCLLSIGKMVSIFGLGGFAFYAGFGFSTAFSTYLLALNVIDLPFTIYKNGKKAFFQNRLKQSVETKVYKFTQKIVLQN